MDKAMVTQRATVLSRRLFALPGGGAYAVLDGAAIPNLLAKLGDDSAEPVCLYRGELIPDLAQVAPYQIRLEPGTPLTQWVLEEGWGQHWGIFVLSPADWRTMREHLSSLTMAYDPEVQPLYFRYYDPRVLRSYLPTCTADELSTLFGPISRILCEDEHGDLLSYSVSGGQLQSERVSLANTQP